MKSTLFVLMCSMALSSTTFGQLGCPVSPDGIEIENTGSNVTWDISWDGTTLSFFKPNSCSSETVWQFQIPSTIQVTYQATWNSCYGDPNVYSPLGITGGFGRITEHWQALGKPHVWSGVFETHGYNFQQMQFSGFQAKLIFGTECESGEDDDFDGVCNSLDLCPNDPQKTVPGNCGCGVVDTEILGDVDCDGDYDIDDVRLAMQTFGIEEGQEDSCPSDIDRDGSVGFSDILRVCHNWGPCSS